MGSLDDSDLEPRAPVKRLAILLGVLLIVWILLLSIFSSRPRDPEGERQELRVYYGAFEIKRNRAEAADWEMVQYRVELGYPSTAVHEFYRKILENEGWTPRPADKLPEWQLTTRRGKTETVFDAAWVDARQLRRMDLRLVAEPDDEPDRMLVIYQRSRGVLPDVRPGR